MHERNPELPVWMRFELWIALTVLLAAAYFYGGASWNQNARLDAIFTFVEPGPQRFTFRIDAFLPDPERGINTGDWTRAGAHYFANKAPGSLLLGALAYLLPYGIEAAFGFDYGGPVLSHLNSYLINLCVSVLPLAIAAACWARALAPRTGCAVAALLALLTVLGTALLPYSTQLWGHITAAAFVMLGLATFPGACAGRPRALVATGALLALAVACDFLALPALAGALLALGGKQRARALWAALGAVPPVLLVLGYQWYCFGSALHLPTAGTNPEFLDDRRLFGLFGALSPEALFQLTIGSYRGALIQMPLLLLVIPGWLRWWRRDRRDLGLWLSAGGTLITLLWVATFNGWHGGASVCARYLIVALPLAALALSELGAERRTLATLLLLGLASACNMLAVSAVSPLALEDVSNPLWNPTYRDFWSGSLHPYVLPIRLQQLAPGPPRHLTCWNWGELLGLSGSASLLPWLALVGAGCAGAWLTARAEDRAGPRPGPGVRTP